MAESEVSVRSGYEHLMKKSLNKAFDVFNVLVSSPKEGDVWKDSMIGLALIYRSSGAFPEALSTLKEVLEVKPDDKTANYNIGNLYLELGQFAMAIQYYEKALLTDPEMVDAYINRGIAWFNIDEYAYAIKDFKNALVLDSGNVRVMIDMGICHIKQERFESAIDLFDQVLKEDGENVNALLGKGLALFYMDRYDDSIICFEAATTIRPDFYIAHYYKGYILKKLDLLDESEEAIRKALSIREDYPLALFELAMIRKAKEDIDGSLELLERSIKKYSGVHEMALFEMGRIHLHARNDPDSALSSFKRILETNQYVAVVWYETGLAFMKKKDKLDRARFCFENSIQLGKDDIETGRSLAKVHEMMGDLESALNVLRGLTEKFPDAKINFSMANVCFKNKKYKESIEYAERSLTLDQNIPESLLVMGRSYGALGKNEEYKQCLRRYLGKVHDDDLVKEELASIP